jgi:hypothetical protein
MKEIRNNRGNLIEGTGEVGKEECGKKRTGSKYEMVEYWWW